MNQENLYNKTTLTRVVISKILDERNPDTIKAMHVPGYDNPDKIIDEEHNVSFVPDITAFFDNEAHVYEIELEKNNMPTDKWKLFSAYAKKNNGSLFLLVPDYIKEDIKKELYAKNINAGVIYFETA